MSDGNFCHLHTHSEYSSLDGLSKIQEIVDRAVGDNQPAVAITDHGVCAAHPHLQRVATEAGIKPIMGIEAYFVNDRMRRGIGLPEGKKKSDLTPEELAAYDLDMAEAKDYWHLILWAATDEGLHNLWAMSTEANRDGLYYKPRMDWDTLQRYNTGVMCSTACLRGPVTQAILNDDEDAAIARMSRLQAIFPDRLYVELHTNTEADQLKANPILVDMASRFSVPTIAVSDSHYACIEHEEAHKVWIAAQTGKSVNDDSDLFSGHSQYHVMTEAEVRHALNYLPESVVSESIANTVLVADQCNTVMKANPAPPVFSPKDLVTADNEMLLRVCMDNWGKTLGKSKEQSEYEDRFVMEIGLLTEKKFCGYFLMVSDYCLDPATPVLTDDLRWVEVGKLEVGDRLAGFDEERVRKNQKSHRYWHSGEVVNTKRVVLPTYKVVLSDGTETITSEDHKWLVSSPKGTNTRWVRTKELRVGQKAQKLVDEWDTPNTWEAGYLAGILDGEGYLSQNESSYGGRSLTIGFAQKAGKVLDTSLRILDAWGFDYSVLDHGSERNGLHSVTIRGGRSEVLRLLGMCRPQRLLGKLDLELLGRLISIDHPDIVEITSLGLGEVIALETTTGTLVAQGFAHHNCLWAKRQGILIGPGRGSGGGSLVAYLSGITDIDPVETDLLFERFMTKGRTELPDFDVDFPSSRINEVLDYIAHKYGEDSVVRVGTHVRLKNKGVIRKVASALNGSAEDINWGDIEVMSKLITKAESSSAGLGISWDELMTEYEKEFAPYRAKYPELFKYADIFVGRLNAYGKHAAGVVISPRDDLTHRLPLRVGDDGRLIAEYDMDALAFLGLVKFDFLAVTTLDTLQMCIDLVYERTGTRINPYDWTTEYEDADVWKFLSDGNTKGCFQIETPAGTKITKDLRPENMHDLADVITLDRPGPMRSGLDQAYLRRRHGKEAVTYVDSRLETVLNRSYGVLLYQEDIMKTCMVLAGYDDEEADKVRKILGKKKVEAAKIEGAKFVDAAIERGMDPTGAQNLWNQMEEFARYSFNRAHAYGYAMLSYWCGYLKYHYPQEFYVAAMSMLDSDTQSKVVDFVSEARRRGYQVLPPDINESKKEYSIVGSNIRYGLGSVLGIGEVAVKQIIENQPYLSYQDFREKKVVNVGIVRKLIQVGAFDSFGVHRAQLLAELDREESGELTQCVDYNEHKQGAPNDLPCNFDWSSEPVRIGARGKPLKATPIPKKCTVRCRNYRKAEPAALVVQPYTEVEIRNIEMELLGVHLSSTPFDKANEQFGDEIWTATQLEAEDRLQQACLIGIVKQIREKLDRNQRPFAIVSLFAQDGTIDALCFNTNWKEFKGFLKENALVMAVVSKTTEYGYQVLDAAPAEKVMS